MILKLFFFFFFFFFFLQLSIGSESCETTYCGYQSISFPFQLTNRPTEYRCAYPGFDLSCNYNRSETIITFPSSGDFSVQLLDNYNQLIGVTDPAGCLAKRLLEGFDLSGTPFEPVYLENFTLLNCSNDVSASFEVTRIQCLSSENNSVLAVPVDRPDLFAPLSSSCSKIATVSLPQLEKWEYLSDRIWLIWKEPDCKRCLRNRGTCQYKKQTGLDIGCSADIGQGSRNIAKYFTIITGVSFLCLTGLVICIPSLIEHYSRKWRRRTDTEISDSIILQPTAARKGLDQRAIEMYPTTLLGESGQLPKPNDNTCSICLFEYQAKDTLRTIPSCMHYFHTNCIDEWLKRNATCPLCRE